MGILPEALVNYLALLGWAPSGGTREIFSMPELVKEFSLQRVTPSPAVFDMEKLYWLNRHYIKASPPERIEKLAQPYFSQLVGEVFSRRKQRNYRLFRRSRFTKVAGDRRSIAGAVGRPTGPASGKGLTYLQLRRRNRARFSRQRRSACLAEY